MGHKSSSSGSTEVETSAFSVPLCLFTALFTGAEHCSSGDCPAPLEALLSGAGVILLLLRVILGLRAEPDATVHLPAGIMGYRAKESLYLSKFVLVLLLSSHPVKV